MEDKKARGLISTYVVSNSIADPAGPSAKVPQPSDKRLLASGCISSSKAGVRFHGGGFECLVTDVHLPNPYIRVSTYNNLLPFYSGTTSQLPELAVGDYTVAELVAWLNTQLGVTNTSASVRRTAVGVPHIRLETDPSKPPTNPTFILPTIADAKTIMQAAGTADGDTDNRSLWATFGVVLGSASVTF